MKKLILLLLIIPILSFGQTKDCGLGLLIDGLPKCNEGTNVSVKQSTKIVNERELVLSEASTNVRVPLTTDLNNYTHILIINHAIKEPMCFIKDYYENCKERAKKIEEILSMSIFEIKNPYKVDKKRSRKEPTFLRTIKNDSYLYLDL